MALRRFIDNGTVQSKTDVVNLAHSAMSVADRLAPNKAFAYLGSKGASRWIGEPLKPSELVGALCLWDDLSSSHGYQGERNLGSPLVSLPTVVNAARELEVALDDMTDEDSALIAGSIYRYGFMQDISYADRGNIFHRQYLLSGVGRSAVHDSGLIRTGLVDEFGPREEDLAPFFEDDLF
jgi:hypothetical protein